MRQEYVFEKGVKNPYTKKIKKQITIKIDEETINYFKALAEETGISYQNLINYYLIDCAKKHKKLSFNWE